jgi:uncharacterized protein
VASPHPAPQLTLSPDDVRLMTLWAQGFVGTDGRRGGVPGMLRRIGAVQLDTISVLARSHELVAYARLGPVPRQRIERAYWHSRQPTAFEYWSHAACILPVEEWPYYGFRRRALQARGMRWHQVSDNVCDEVLARLRGEGPLNATQLGGARGGGEWWDWSETKIAVEWLLDTGQAICARRTGWRRVYDLPERVLPPELLAAEPSDAECVIHLAGVAARALGVVTRADLTDYQRLRWGGAAKGEVERDGEVGGGQGKYGQAITPDEAAAAAGLVPVGIAAAGGGPVTPAWADPSALEACGASGQPRTARGRHRTTLLSPFDSLIWDRKRTLRMFGFEHSLEAYVPKAKRVHGYFTMPLLTRGRLAGRVDPARSGRTLIARKLSLDTASATEPMARALTEAAAWVGCDNVELGQVEPVRLEPRLRKALSELT